MIGNNGDVAANVLAANGAASPKRVPKCPLSRLSNLYHRAHGFFGSGTAQTVDSVNFEVRPGEIYGLLGPNGAGNTTTSFHGVRAARSANAPKGSTMPTGRLGIEGTASTHHFGRASPVVVPLMVLLGFGLVANILAARFFKS